MHRFYDDRDRIILGSIRSLVMLLVRGMEWSENFGLEYGRC